MDQLLAGPYNVLMGALRKQLEPGIGISRLEVSDFLNFLKLARSCCAYVRAHQVTPGPVLEVVGRRSQGPVFAVALGRQINLGGGAGARGMHSAVVPSRGNLGAGAGEGLGPVACTRQWCQAGKPGRWCRGGAGARGMHSAVVPSRGNLGAGAGEGLGPVACTRQCWWRRGCGVADTPCCPCCRPGCRRRAATQPPPPRAAPARLAASAPPWDGRPSTWCRRCGMARCGCSRAGREAPCGGWAACSPPPPPGGGGSFVACWQPPP
jgi:hypothetical protein